MAAAMDTQMRSNQTIKCIRFSKDHITGKPVEIVADLPVGRGFADGTFIAYQNLGWRTYDSYLADKAAKEAEVRRAEEAKKAEDAKAKEKK